MFAPERLFDPDLLRMLQMLKAAATTHRGDAALWRNTVGRCNLYALNVAEGAFSSASERHGNDRLARKRSKYRMLTIFGQAIAVRMQIRNRHRNGLIVSGHPLTLIEQARRQVTITTIADDDDDRGVFDLLVDLQRRSNGTA